MTDDPLPVRPWQAPVLGAPVLEAPVLEVPVLGAPVLEVPVLEVPVLGALSPRRRPGCACSPRPARRA
jgi:hypothetical protein